MDPEVSKLRERAITEDEAKREPVCYFERSGVLMRKWRPPEVPPEDEWKVIYRIVLPAKYRKDVLEVTDQLPTAGHLGVRKSDKAIFLLSKDEKGYGRVCRTCQMVGKPNQKIKPDPLRPITSTGESFSRTKSHHVWKDVKIYIDDVIIYSSSWGQHVKQIRAFFERLRQANLVTNLVKSEIAQDYIEYLGHVVGQGSVKLKKAKVQAIAKYPVPNDKKALMKFWGMAGYYRKFCRTFSDIVNPLTNLMKKGIKLHWDKNCQMLLTKVNQC